jgi:hypothetical protein
MHTIASWTLTALICVAPAVAAPKPAAPKPAAPKPAPPATTQLQVQLKKLTAERDDLKERLAATEDLQQDLAAAQKSKDLARQEAEGLRKELSDIKSSLNENQSGSDAILQELQKAKADLETCMAEKETQKKGMEDASAKDKNQTENLAENGLPAGLPARALNLNRVTPKAKNVSRGVVVVNVLISDSGEVLDSRLTQGLPGTDVDVRKANEACVEAAKRLVFDPARSADGKTKLRVWQAVGFLIN